MQQNQGFVDWMFRSRTTGKITVVQIPNIPLAVWLAATVVGRLGLIEGRAADAISVIADVALAVWAVMEGLDGVNPFRRALGLFILAWLIYTRLLIG